MKLTVEYDPMVGHACRDGEAEAWVDNIIETCKLQPNKDDWWVSVGSSLLIDCFRLRLAQGVITKDQIAFKFQDEILEHDGYGTIKHWPRGFCDQDADIMIDILKIQSNGWKKRRKL